MKLVIAVVQGQDADTLLQALREANFRLTIVDSVGGFLRERNATILIGVEEARLDELWRVIRATCQTRVDFITPYTPALGPGDMYSVAAGRGAGRRGDSLGPGSRAFEPL